MNKFTTRFILICPAVLAVVFTVLFSVLYNVFCYIDGTKGEMSLSIDLLFKTMFPYLILTLLLVVWAIISICVTFGLTKTISHELIISAIVLAVVIGSPPVALFIAPPGAETFLRGYVRWIPEHVDIDGIQDWIAKAPEFYWNESETYSSDKGKPEGFPQCLKDCEFQYVSFEQSDLDGSNIVRLEWGGPFSHYGVVVGSPQMKMPDKTEYEINRSYVEFRKAIKPGAYIYEGG